MEKHLRSRPKKTPFSIELQKVLRGKAVSFIQSALLPDEKIIRILLIGSSVKGNFGEYDAPGFRGSMYSDFDFIVFVEDEYKIPSWLEKEQSAKPFPDDNMNLAYRNKCVIDNKYDLEIFFVRREKIGLPDIVELGEKAGIPMTEESTIPNIVVYSKGSSSEL